MRYTLEELLRENESRQHLITQSVLEKVNHICEFLEKFRGGEVPQPRTADKIICMHPTLGLVSDHGHLTVCEAGAEICVFPSIPYISESGYIETSGEVFVSLSFEEVARQAVFRGSVRKNFWTWGAFGPCAQGGVYFQAEVQLWEVTDSRLSKF